MLHAISHLIDFSLAVSACAIALTSQPGSEVTLGGVRRWSSPPARRSRWRNDLFVHLRRSRQDTPRWRTCLILAVVAGLLVGPLKFVLAAPIADLAGVLCRATGASAVSTNVHRFGGLLWILACVGERTPHLNGSLDIPTAATAISWARPKRCSVSPTRNTPPVDTGQKVVSTGLYGVGAAPDVHRRR